jgi:hypothetical protein
MSIDNATPDQWDKAAKPKTADVTDALATLTRTLNRPLSGPLLSKSVRAVSALLI